MANLFSGIQISSGTFFSKIYHLASLDALTQSCLFEIIEIIKIIPSFIFHFESKKVAEEGGEMWKIEYLGNEKNFRQDKKYISQFLRAFCQSNIQK